MVLIEQEMVVRWRADRDALAHIDKSVPVTNHASHFNDAEDL
jgi:hypothetical protein